LEVYLVPVRDAVQAKDPRNIDMATDLWNDRSKDRTRLMFLLYRPEQSCKHTYRQR
jgi:ferritin-like protein